MIVSVDRFDFLKLTCRCDFSRNGIANHFRLEKNSLTVIHNKLKREPLKYRFVDNPFILLFIVKVKFSMDQPVRTSSTLPSHPTFELAAHA